MEAPANTTAMREHLLALVDAILQGDKRCTDSSSLVSPYAIGVPRLRRAAAQKAAASDLGVEGAAVSGWVGDIVGAWASPPECSRRLLGPGRTGSGGGGCLRCMGVSAVNAPSQSR